MLSVHKITNHRHGPARLQASIKKIITQYGPARLLIGYKKSFVNTTDTVPLGYGSE